MAVVVTPVDALVLMVGTETIECQVTAHTLTDADPAGGEKIRTGCGDVVTIPADSTEVGTLEVTLFPERGVAGFEAWTWTHAGESVDFTLTVNTGAETALQWTGKLTVAAIPEQQYEYPKKETADVSWSIIGVDDPGRRPGRMPVLLRGPRAGRDPRAARPGQGHAPSRSRGTLRASGAAGGRDTPPPRCGPRTVPVYAV